MTPEREAEIRAVLSGDLSVDMDTIPLVVARMADDLLGEVDRLRAGIETARDALAASSCMGGHCAGPGCYGCRDSTLAGNLGDLLNQTEGDDHE